MERGEIYMAQKSKRDMHYHPIVILRCDKNADDITSCIVSHQSTNDNILLKKEHFDNDAKYSKTFDENNPSYLVVGKFIKLKGDIEAKVVGKVTKEGLEFIEAALKDIQGKVWSKPIWDK